MGETASGLRSGHVIAGRYVIEKMVGRGGMGEVYAARDLKLRRRVAIKTLRDSGYGGQRLRREAETVAQLGHPGIVSIFDVLEERGEWILVMELVEGVSLRRRLASGPLPPPEVARLIAQAAAALSAAHAQGLVHRDVKPDNLIVRADGRLALLDFGVAKVVEKLDSAATTAGSPEALTDTGAVVGTPIYLAPEQAHGEAVSRASDQFSLAVVAYELLVGTVPWPTGNMARLIAAIMQDPPRPLPERLSALDPLFARALAKKAADRFPSVQQFSDQLSAALAGVGPEPLPMPPQLASTLPGAALADSSARTHRTTARTPTVTLRRLVTIAAPAALVTMAAVAAVMLRPHSSAPPPRASFRLAELQPSRTVPAAEVAWRRGLRHLASGEQAMARQDFEDAIAVDADFASAHLQRLLDETSYCPTKLEIARPHFHAARRASDTLSARDRELLDALEPAVLDPPDLREVAARLRALTARRPDDAQIWDALSIAENKLFHFAASAHAAIRAAQLDPSDALVGQLTLAQAQETIAEHNRISRACFKAFPGAEYCRSELAYGLQLTGECGEMEQVARELKALAPGAPRGPLHLAAALAGQNASPEAIAMALADAPPLLPPAARTRGEWQNQVSMAMWSGDFAGALKRIDDKAELDPIFAATRKVEALWEIGDKRGAGQAALTYLKRAPALPRFERPESDPLPTMLARARAGDAITEADYVARREAWIQSWRARIDDQAWPTASMVIGGLALSYPQTVGEARALAARLDTFGGPPPTASRRFWCHDGPPGEMLRQARRLDEAIPRLRAEADRCSFDVERVRARLGLGLALEEKRDVPGACASYRAVLAQWGGAKPRSVTADAARARAKALACN